MEQLSSRLTKQQAKNIVLAVVHDPVCKKSIGSSVVRYLPASWGIAGSVRNIGFMLANGSLFTGEGPDAETTAQVCEGIAQATAAAINKAKIPGVASAEAFDRPSNGPEHVATAVILVRYGAVIFDWHATLQIYNPLIYPSIPAWAKGNGGVEYQSFTGF